VFARAVSALAIDFEPLWPLLISDLYSTNHPSATFRSAFRSVDVTSKTDFENGLNDAVIILISQLHLKLAGNR